MKNINELFSKTMPWELRILQKPIFEDSVETHFTKQGSVLLGFYLYLCSLFSDDYDVQLDSDEEPLSLLERRKAERKADSAAAAPPPEEEVSMGIYPD